MTTEELTWLGGEMTVDGVARLGEVLHGLKRRRTCGRRKLILATTTTSHFHVVQTVDLSNPQQTQRTMEAR